jgi:hypothetical protein
MAAAPGKFAPVPGGAAAAPVAGAAAAPAAVPVVAAAAPAAAAAAAAGAKLVAGVTSISGASVLSGVFYFAVAAFVIFLVLVFIHYTIRPVFTFVPGDGGIIPIPLASDQQTAWTTTTATSTASAGFTGIPACNYTLSMDIFLTGDLTDTSIPRVLLYNASQARTLSTTDTSGTMLGRFADTNFMIWLEPQLNNLYVTPLKDRPAGPVTGPDREFMTHKAVVNVPLRTPFRLTTVVSTGMTEVYINGELQLSFANTTLKTVSGTPPPNFWALAQAGSGAAINNNVSIGSVYFWPRVLSATEIQQSSTAPVKPSMFKLS